MKYILVFALSLCSGAFAADDYFLNCNKLINGNDNGKATTIVKAVNLNLFINLKLDDTELHGTYVTKSNQPVTAHFLFPGKRKINKDRNIITVTSHDSNFLTCGSSGPVCHTWEELTYNTKTGEALFESSQSYKSFGGDKSFKESIRFVCKAI